MGTDKALLPWGTGVLVEEIAAKVAAAAGSVTLIGNPIQYAHLRYSCLPDLRPGMGPLSGIEAALASGRGELNLILACDMPHVEDAHLANLVHTAHDLNANCVVTGDETGAIHPLCAVYRRACLQKVKEALDTGELRLMRLIEDLQATLIKVPGRIRNINTAVEWEGISNG